MKEVSHLLEKPADSWAHYLQNEKGIATVSSDTLD